MNRWKLAFATVLAVFMLTGTATTAAAHTSLDSTSPTNGSAVTALPASVVVTFTKPVTIVDKGLTLRSPTDTIPGTVTPDATKKQWTLTPTPTTPPPHGVYTYTWKFAAADGHVITGNATFTLTAATTGSATTPTATAQPSTAPTVTTAPTTPTATPTADATSATDTGNSTSLTWLTTRTGLGAGMFGTLCLGAALMALALVRPTPTALTALGRRFALVAGIVLTISALVHATARHAYLSDDSWQPFTTPTWLITFFRTDVLGLAIGLRFLAGALALIAAAALTGSTRRVRIGGGLVALASVTAIASYLFDGHTTSIEPSLLMRFGSAAHVTGAMVWGGGLLVIAALALAGLRSTASPASPTLLQHTLLPFARIAGLTVAIIAASGVLMAWTIMPSLNALWATPWGLALIVKTIAVAIALSFGAFHHQRATRAQPLPLRTLTLEVGALCGIIAASAVLVGLSPTL